MKMTANEEKIALGGGKSVVVRSTTLSYKDLCEQVATLSGGVVPDANKPLSISVKDKKQLLANGGAFFPKCRRADLTFAPVMKLFQPDGNGTWLLAAVNPDKQNEALVLWEDGESGPRIGITDLEDVRTRRSPLGYFVERDICWTASGSIKQYWDAAKKAGEIVQLSQK